jgi:hypothetical protein
MKMELSDEEFQTLSSYVVLPTGELPPTPVYLALVSLVRKPTDIKASLSSVEFGQNTTVWRVHLLTSNALAFAEVGFHAERYTRSAEEPYRRGERPPAFDVTEAWARPLDSIVRYSIRLDGVILGSDWFPVSVALRFRDVVGPVELPAQSFTDNEVDQERSDKFLDALREEIPWLTALDSN